MLCPICTGLEPMDTATHGPTMTVNDMALLAGGLLLSTAQIVNELVVLPWLGAGAQRKTPLPVKSAPAGAPGARLNATGGVPPNT